MQPWYQVTPFMDSADVLYWAATSRANHGMAANELARQLVAARLVDRPMVIRYFKRRSNCSAAKFLPVMPGPTPTSNVGAACADLFRN